MTDLNSLLQSADKNGEVIHTINGSRFRIDLKPDDIRLWYETLESVSTPCNLLLACQHGGGNLKDTCLTWVVGSAIRPFQIESPEEVAPLLHSLGIELNLARSLPDHCPGLASETTWAFYLDRHGQLSASPVLNRSARNS